MPVLITGYAAYGINMRPAFNDNLLPIYRDGIGYAVCHARGGGELGDEWHRAAMKATKHLSWEDFIACAEWLVANGYTRSRSEEHTSELQSLMRNSYAVFCLKKQTKTI